MGTPPRNIADSLNRERILSPAAFGSGQCEAHEVGMVSSLSSLVEQFPPAGPLVVGYSEALDRSAAVPTPRRNSLPARLTRRIQPVQDRLQDDANPALRCVALHSYLLTRRRPSLGPRC